MQQRYTEVTSALYTAATTAYGPPVPSQPVPSTIRVHVTNLQRYTLAYPDWASQSSHLVEVARLKERIRAAWDVLLREKDVGLAPLPAAPGQPTKVDYRRTLGARYVPPADPVYVVGVPVPLHQQAAVALDQLRQRHLAPLEALSLAHVWTITGWEGRPLGPPPNATIANLRAIIRRAAATVPYHDLLEYRLFGQLEDAQFAAIVDLINSILRGVPVPQAHSADFINLPKKTPHGPIANGRPLTNLATIWKLTAALIKDHYQPRLVQGGILPPYQFGMSPHCSSVELLRVLHDVWWDRWRRRLEAWVLSDDVRHAYGSINHTTEYAVLTAAGISPADAATLQHHDRALEVHMGGADGRSPSSTRLGAGTGQGCPVSGMKYCIYAEVRGHEACRSVPPADTPAGPLNRVLLMDDTQWLPGDRCHLPALASGIERAGRLTNLDSDPTKTVLIGTDMRDGQVHFLNDTVYLNGHPVRCATSQDYVRVLGRHALPHLFHPVDSRRLFSGTRAACRALRAPRLPAHYPLAMYTAKCHGTVNWFTSVRPPLRLDNAYTAELYTAWVALTARGPSPDPAIGFRSGAWHFADCKGYITAQEGRCEPEDSLQGDLIRSCRNMAHGHAPPRHLYSHITGTWLDALLDQVDEAAGRAADTCPDAVGWLGPLQQPRVCFSHAGLQVHDAVPHARRALLASHHAYSTSPPPQLHPALNEYANVVSHGLITWGDHLTVTGIRLSLFPPRDAPCPLCNMPASGDHILSCPLDPLIRAHYHRWLAAPLSQRCHAWRHCTPTAWGTLVLWGDEPFILAVDGSPAHHTIATYTIDRLGAISTPHRDALLHRGLRPARLRRLLCDVVLTTVLLHKRHAVPVLPLADHFSPLPRVPVNQSLANNPPPEWYHVANWAPTPGSGRWPAWDVLLGLWLSGDLLLAPKVKSAISTRNKHSPYRVLYVYIEKNQMPPAVRQEIELKAHDVIISDSLGRHGLAPHLPDGRRLWAIHYGAWRPASVEM